MEEGDETGTPAFAGQASDTTWLQRLREELNQDPQPKPPKQRERLSTSSSRSSAGSMGGPKPWMMEDTDRSIVGEQLLPFELILKDDAGHLIEGYFNSVHISFPILHQMQFLRQYEDLYDTMDQPNYADQIFIALLQLVFAIGAIHAHVTDADWVGDPRDHLLHFARARELAVNNGILNDACSIVQVQFFGLAAMYLLITDQVNRWVMDADILLENFTNFIQGLELKWPCNPSCTVIRIAP